MARNIDKQRAVQSIAKDVLEALGSTIHALDTEDSIARRAVQMLGDKGVKETWYYNCLDFIDGLAAEQSLHKAMRSFVNPSTTFCELYEYANQKIKTLGFENLDFANNLGHSIVLNRDDRIYIEVSNQKTLGSVNFFTFEPHIAKIGSPWGFKHEQIYFFNGDGSLEVL